MNGGTQVNQHLGGNNEVPVGFPLGLRVSSHTRVWRKAFDGVQSLQPTQRVAIVYIMKLVREKQLAYVSDPVLPHENDAVASCVTFVEIKNLNFVTAEVNRQAIAIRDLLRGAEIIASDVSLLERSTGTRITVLLCTGLHDSFCQR